MDKLVRVGSKTTLQMHRDYERARGDLVGLFTALAADFDITRVLYPGSYIHLAPSFVFSSVTYVDTDKRAEKFFSDRSSIAALVEQRKRYDGPAELTFHHADYRTDLEAPEQGFDLLVSLYAGFVSQACKRYLRPSGWLVANNSHGDASMASIDPDYEFVATLHHRNGRYRITSKDLDSYFVPKRRVEVSPELLRSTGRGVGYTKSATAYVFQRRL